MAPYADRAKEIEAEFRRLIFEEKGWNLEKDKKGVKIYTVMTPNSEKNKCFKAEGLVEMSPERVIDFVHPFAKYRPQFDPNLVSCECLEELSPNTAIAYEVVKPKVLGVGILGDSIHLIQLDKEEDYYYCICGGVNYEKEWTKSNGIRGWPHPSGLVAMKTDNPNVSKVIVFIQADFELPDFLIRPMVEKATKRGILKYYKKLRKMKDAEYKRLGPENVFYRNR